jgi:osmotically-inducible protein OsmY
MKGTTLYEGELMMHARGRIALLVACATLAAPAFAMDHFYKPTKVALHSSEPPIVVTESRVTEDEITSQVVDVLAGDPRLAGRIGVLTLDREVELTGIVTTAGQSRQAERDAMSVRGVRNVSNKLATRIGSGRY